jgi:hypothetical protein
VVRLLLEIPRTFSFTQKIGAKEKSEKLRLLGIIVECRIRDEKQEVKPSSIF